MVDDMRGELKKFKDLNELSNAAASDISGLITETVSMKGHFSIALSGGNTPRLLHNLLGTVYREKIPWAAVSVFFGDERYVPHNDKLSNYLMARETLLDHVPIPAANVHPVPTGLPDPEQAAQAYEDDLRKSLPQDGDSFDLLLLGLGKEGHTASLFPHSAALDESRKWVVPVDVNAIPARRISLTYPVLNRSSVVYFLVSGAEKKEALVEVMNEESDPHVYPARGIAPSGGRLVWWVDASALPG